MGNIGSQIGEALGQGITNAMSAYQHISEMNRRIRLEQEQAADRATQRAEHRLGLLQGEARNQFLNQDYDAVASGIPGMNEQRKALGLGAVPGMKPTPIKMPDLDAVGPFDASRGAPQPEISAKGWTPKQVRSLRSIAGVAPHYANASGDIWDETTGEHVRTLPLTSAREKMASNERLAAERLRGADARAAEINSIRMMALMLGHQDRQEALRGQNDRFQQGQGKYDYVKPSTGPDGKVYLYGIKGGKAELITGPGGKPLLAPPDASSVGGGLLDDGPDAPAPAPASGGGWFGGWFGGGNSAPQPQPSAAPPTTAPANVKPLPGATPRANAAFGAASAAAPGMVVSSVKRDPKRNAAVGGVPSSYHLTGDAVDMVGPKGQPPTREQFIKVRDAIAPYGYEALLHDKGSGLHIHIEPAPGVRGKAKPPQKPIKPQASGPRADLKAQRKAGQELADLILSEMGE